MAAEILDREGLRVPRLRFEEFEGEWEFKKLGNECNHISYGLTVRPKFVDDGIPLISAREVKTGSVNFSQAPKISIEDFKKLSTKAKPTKGDIFLTKTGTIGFTAKFEEDFPVAITQNIAVIRLTDIEYNSSSYLMQYFKTEEFYRSAISKVNQSTIMDLQLGDIRKLEIPFTSFPEQQKIATFLTAVDQKIQQLNTKKDLLIQYKKGVMQQLFSQELRFTDDTSTSLSAGGNAFPDWEEKKLGEVGKIITGSTPKTSIKEYYEGQKLFVSPADIQDNRYVSETKTTLTELGFSKGRKVKKGSVLFVCIGSTIGKVVQAFEDCLTNQQLNSIEASDKNSNDYIYSLLDFEGARIKLLAGVQAVPQINKTDFSNLKFNFPSLPEQQKIAAFLSSLDTKIAMVGAQLESTERFKKGLLQGMFV